MTELPIEDQIRAELARLRRGALKGTFNGRPETMVYMERCRSIHAPSGTLAIFTRDTGYHSSGWWKNPDYERCWHLSLSPLPGQIITLAPVVRELDKKIRRHWLDAAFGEHLSYVWVEPPFSEDGKRREVWHWRLFCDANWTPILPRKEVYTKEFTELGWKSSSDVLADELAAAGAEP